LAKFYDGNVWDNTIIVTKGDTPKDGPIDAAKEVARKERSAEDNRLSNTGHFNILLFESLPPTNVYVKGGFTSDDLNNDFGVFKASEPERILAKYESLMNGHLERPIRLSLKKVKCSKCPEETDPRLASSKCHLETESFHPDTECIHRGHVIEIHPSHCYDKHTSHYVAATTRQEFDDSPQAWTVRVVTIGIVNPTRPDMVPGYWNCCHQGDANSRGCKQFYRCCEKENHSSGCQKIYNECRHKCEEPPCFTICKDCKNKSDTKGCKERCKNCKNSNPYNLKGCIEVSHNFDD